MGANGKRKTIPVRGRYVRSATVGPLVFVETLDGDRRRLYLTHRDWIPALDAISVARIRAIWAEGAYTADELADRFGTSRNVILSCVDGREQFSHLPYVGQGSASVARGSDRTPTAQPLRPTLPWYPCDAALAALRGMS